MLATLVTAKKHSIQEGWRYARAEATWRGITSHTIRALGRRLVAGAQLGMWTSGGCYLWTACG